MHAVVCLFEFFVEIFSCCSFPAANASYHRRGEYRVVRTVMVMTCGLNPISKITMNVCDVVDYGLSDDVTRIQFVVPS